VFYEINISLNGHHFFATHERSLTTHSSFIHTLKILKNKFPESEGYEVTATEQVMKITRVNVGDSVLK